MMRRSDRGGLSIGLLAPVVAALLGGGAAIATAAQIVNVSSSSSSQSDTTTSTGSGSGMPGAEVDYGAR